MLPSSDYGVRFRTEKCLFPGLFVAKVPLGNSANRALAAYTKGVFGHVR